VPGNIMNQSATDHPGRLPVNYQATFAAIPGIHTLLLADAPRYTTLAVTDDLLATTGQKRTDMIGKGHFDLFPENPDDSVSRSQEMIRTSFERVITTKEPYQLPLQRYDITGEDGYFTERYWAPMNKPVLDEQGEVMYIIHSAVEVTGKVLAERREARIRDLEKAYNLFTQAPVMIAIVSGPNHVLELANQGMLDFWRPASDLIGFPLPNALPELEQLGAREALDQALRTGEVQYANEKQVTLRAGGPHEIRYLNLVYKPFFEQPQDMRASGVYLVAHNVTEQVLSRQHVKESEEELRMAMEIAQLGTFRIELPSTLATYSDRIRNWFGLSSHSQDLQTFFGKIHPDDQPYVEQRIQGTLLSEGNSRHDLNYRVPNPENGQTRYLHSFGKTLFRPNGTPYLIVGIVQDISQHILSQKQVEEREQELKKFKFIADHARDSFILMQQDGTFAYLNQQALKAWGYTEEEGRTLTVPDVDPIFQRQEFAELFVRAQSEPIPVFETLHKRKDGHVYPVEVHLTGLTIGKKPYLITVARDISVRKKIDEALRESNERFELVAKATQDAIWDWNLKTDEVWWNEGFKSLFGYQQHEIEPGVASWNNRLHPLDKDRVIQGIHDVIDRGRKQWSAEYRFLKADGSYAMVFDRGYALHDENGKPYRMLGSMTDITERKNMEEATRKSEQTLRNTILQAPVAMGIFKGPSFVVEIANSRMYEIWGRTPGEMLGKPLLEGLPEVPNQGLEELLQQVYRTGKPATASELPLRLPRGGTLATVYLNFVYEPFREADGSVSGVLMVASEVTEQVKAREMILEKKKELEFFMDFMPQMVWNALPNGLAYLFNKVYRDYTGLSMEQLEGAGWYQLLHPDDIDKTRQVWQEAVATGCSYEVEHRLRRHDGTYRWFLTRGLPLTDDQGQILKWYGTTTDIQEHKQAAELLESRVQDRTRELRETNATLKRINAELEQFTYVSHHDLQEPLRKIHIFTEMVRSESFEQLSNASQQRLEKVTAAANRMSAALNDVLNFASLSKEETFVDVNLNDVLDSVKLDLELAISDKNAVISADPLPVLKAVPRQMHQLLYNLLNNALKFSRTDAQPHISINCRVVDPEEITEETDLEKGKTYYEITVQDNGIGFDPHYAQKIFVLFQRLHSRDAYAGTGIGLALARKVVLKHGGKIRAESTPGQGATFQILLPAH
jgi:PAS domain S-box-containing protein